MIDKLPLEQFFSHGAVIDIPNKANGAALTIVEAQAELARISYTLKPLAIVLVRTGRAAFYSEPDYLFRGPDVTVESTRWLFEQGVRVMGIDAGGWDAPLDQQAQQALAQQEPGIFWAAHQADLPHSQIERLVNLDALPPFRFTSACFPLKVKGGRAVAVLPD